MFMKDGTFKDMPFWAQHFLIHVVKRCTMVLVKWIDIMKDDSSKSIPPWVQDFLIHVGKMNAMILVRWIDDMKEEGKKGEIDSSS